MREDTFLAVVLSFLSHTNIFNQRRSSLENCNLESKLQPRPITRIGIYKESRNYFVFNPLDSNRISSLVSQYFPSYPSTQSQL